LEFNGMAERIEAAQEQIVREQEERRRMEAGLRNAERLASLGRLAAGLAHEIGSPLNVISGRAETLQRWVPGQEPAQKSLRIIAEQIDRIARIVRGMLDFARGRESRLQPTDITAEIRKVLDLLEYRLDEAGVRVACDLPATLPLVVADGDQLNQVFLNLVTNALDAMPQGGTLTIAVRTDDKAPDGLVISFEDTGTGILPEDIDRIFDPFFTTKEVGHGTGLGLSVSYGIVREHGGSIEAASPPGGGARFTVRLPVAGTRQEGSEQPVSHSKAPAPPSRIAS
jgi:two-component system, NtrC family, sensor kinase